MLWCSSIKRLAAAGSKRELVCEPQTSDLSLKLLVRFVAVTGRTSTKRKAALFGTYVDRQIGRGILVVLPILIFVTQQNTALFGEAESPQRVSRFGDFERSREGRKILW